jgi:mono/diheme cytochrome c family protein
MTTNNHSTRRHAAGKRIGAIALIAGLAATAVLTGCRGDRSEKPPRQFFPDMDEQPKVLPQTATNFYEDGRSDRPLVARTVPFGATPHDPAVTAEAGWAGEIRAGRDRMLRADPVMYLGIMPGSTVEEPVYADYMPVEVDRDLVLRGQERFDIFCSACHGYTGQGDGTVGRLWSYAPANLLGELYRDRSADQGKDGYLYKIIRRGLQNPDGTYRMPPYGHAIDERDAWAIVAYIRALQASQGVNIDQLDPADRARLSPTGGTQ